MLQSPVDGPLGAWCESLRQAFPDLRNRYGVRHLWLFGPHRYAMISPGIPLDILADIDGVLTYDNFLALQATLRKMLDTPVELVLKGSMDPDVTDLVIPEMIAINDHNSAGTEA